jgi:hypothetical protein
VKEKEISKNKEAEVKNSNVASKEALKLEIVRKKDKAKEDITVKNRAEGSEAAKGVNLKVSSKADFVVEDSIVGNSNGDKLQKGDRPLGKDESTVLAWSFG